MKTFVTDTGGYVHHGRPNGIWAKSVIRAQRTAKSSYLDTGPLNIISDVFDLSAPGNNRIPKIQISNYQTLPSEHSRKPQVQHSKPDYDEKLSPGGVG
ncbi:unnamed protein product [Hymenolepis diminuta]|uniref:Uncharacterized protein n=1 Tax=Hymenolepis diminuta TaxID=6216 RepID=A0A0R3SK05_HYMDI|nr:unnamed protein product [Hymenolepis diminuta]